LPVPETVISEILNSVNIVDFISQYVQLKKAGKNYTGLCPFHSEKTPSFSVSPDKNLFYCFGCGEGGNLFSFLMKYESLTFPEAAEAIARQHGINIPKTGFKGGQYKESSEREQILKINRETADYYHYILHSSGSGKKAAEYLKKRDIPPEISDEYYLGMAPEGWDNLSSHLKKKGFAPEIAEKAGLIVKRKSGRGYYDRFRSRLMFPIYDVRGDIIAFGGRILGQENPKYLNSPETPVYSKSRSLYGLKQAAAYCRKEKQVYIVEGYMDVLALSKKGIKNSIASLGTSLTSGHVKMLKGYAEKMTLVYDGDDAGLRAAARSVDVFANEEADVSIMVLPENMDPDDYINKYGSSNFLEKADNAESAVQFLTKNYLDTFGNSIEGKIKAVSSLEPLLKKIKDPVTLSLYVKEAASLLDIPENAVFERLKAGSNPKSLRYNSSEPVKKRIELSKIELSVLTALIDLPELKQEFRSRKIADKINNKVLKKSIENLLESDSESTGFALLDPEIQPLVAKNRIEQGEWNLRQAKILIKQFEYSSRKKMRSAGL